MKRNYTPQQIELRVWLRKHRGIMAEIAALCGVSRPMVSYVANGRRNTVDGKVEEELRKRGVPGWANRPQ